MPKSKLPAFAVVGDLHVNHIFGLMPPTFRLDAGNVLYANKYQAWLWECWLDFCTMLDSYDVENILINGDLVQGINAKDAETLTVNESDQSRFCLDVLQPLIWTRRGGRLVRRALDVYITRGSGFHDGRVGERAEQIAREIGAREVDGARSSWEHWIEWRKKLIYATHHTSTAAVYPLTPLQREMREARERAVDGWLLPDIDIRSHVHRCSAIQDNAGRWMVTAPAWQLATAFSHKVAPAKLPSIGGLVITLDEENQIAVKRKRYNLPLPTVTSARVRPSTGLRSNPSLRTSTAFKQRTRLRT